MPFVRFLFNQSSPLLIEGPFAFNQRELGAHPAWGFIALYAGLFLVIAVPISVMIGLSILRNLRARRERDYREDMLHKAGKAEEAGQFVSAGFIYEKLKDPERAAALYEKGGDFSRAAVIYEFLGDLAKSKEMSERAGDPVKAAETCISMGDYIGAARIYDGLGDKIKAAEAFEAAGNRLAAVRAYREAKNYVKASALLALEGMMKESADMYKLSLGEEMNRGNVEQYHSYGELLEKADLKEAALRVYREISSLDPGYAGMKEKIESLQGAIPEGNEAGAAGPQTPRQEGRIRRGTSLRKIMQSGRMEPRHCLRLWVQVLRAMKDEPDAFGRLSPEGIFIDSNNAVFFDADAPQEISYIAPETLAGHPPDAASTVYSAGVILYEMLVGGLDKFGSASPSQAADGIPAWLDELTMKCIEKEIPRRYGSMDEVFASLKNLKK